jgi:hypothetical protein
MMDFVIICEQDIGFVIICTQDMGFVIICAQDIGFRSSQRRMRFASSVEGVANK